MMRMPKLSAPALFGLAGLLLLPSAPADADVSSLLSSRTGEQDSWRSYMIRAAAGSIHKEELVFRNVDKTGFDPSSRGFVSANGDRTVFSPDAKSVPATPDEERITRHLKKGRLLAVDHLQPPKGFNAGSILDRQANLLEPSFSEEKQTAFVKPNLKGKEIQIAMAFHELKPKVVDYGMPAMLASLVTNEVGDSLASAYANPDPDYAEKSPFDSILGTDEAERFIPPAKQTDHSWAANVLAPTVFSEPEQTCLAKAIYFESANEPLKGRAAVAQVILNRVRNPTFPSTICGVVYQNENWRNACQFSFACDRIPDVIWSRSKYKVAQEVALAVTAGKIYLPEVGDSTHYHATYVKPNWRRSMIKVTQIGLHVFYRTRYGGWG